MTDTNKHPIQDDESYTISVTSTRTDNGKADYKLTGKSTTGGPPFDQGHANWNFLAKKLEEDLSIPPNALRQWHEYLEQHPGSTVRLGRTAPGAVEVFKGTAVKKLFRTP